MKTSEQAVKTKKPKPPFEKQKISPPGVEEKMNPEPHFMNEKYIGSDKLKDKVALITGGDSGIGRSVAAHYAAEGADVAFTYMPQEEEDAEVTSELIKNFGKQALKIRINLLDDQATDKIVDKVVSKFERIDILVNNAAFQYHLDDIGDLDFKQFKHTFEVNIFSYFRLVKSALPHIPEGGCIINTGSILGYVGDDNLIDYSSTKGAIHSFTKSLAKSLAEKNIRVNSVAPGPVWTPLNPAERSHEDVRNFGKNTVFKRPAQPEEIAPAYVYLASEITGSYITGETINLFGRVSGAN